MVLHFFESHAGGVRITQDDHAERISNQEKWYARFIEQLGRRVIIRCQGGDFFAPPFHGSNRGGGDFNRIHAPPSRWRDGTTSAKCAPGLRHIDQRREERGIYELHSRPSEHARKIEAWYLAREAA